MKLFAFLSSLEIIHVNVRNRKIALVRHHHCDRCHSSMSSLVVDHLLPETDIRSDHRSRRANVVVGLSQCHVLVLHQIDHHQRRRARHSGHAVHQRLATAILDGLDLVGNLIEVVLNTGVRMVLYPNFHVFNALNIRVRLVGGGVDDKCYPLLFYFFRL